MTDNQLIALLIQILSQGLIDDGYAGVSVIQAFQPTQQGVNIAPAIYLSKSDDYLYGTKQSNYVFDPLDQLYVVTEIQRIETTFKFQALAIQNPVTPDAYTASDLVNEAGAIIRSQTTVDTLKPYGIGLLRSTAVSNAYDLDDKDQFEAAPAFNAVLVYDRTRIIKVPVIESIDLKISGI